MFRKSQTKPFNFGLNRSEFLPPDPWDLFY